MVEVSARAACRPGAGRGGLAASASGALRSRVPKIPFVLVEACFPRRLVPFVLTICISLLDLARQPAI
jgi:hypothetical protein